MQNGLIKTSSKLIAENCSVSQGTIFLHFGTKDELLYTILKSNIDLLENDINLKCDIKKDPQIFVKKLLDVLSKHEDILSRVYKEENYLSTDLIKQVEHFENTLKNLLLDNYRKHSTKRISIVDSFVVIDAFLSQIKCYLIGKEYTSNPVSLIKQRKGRIVKLYNILFGG